MARGLHVVPRDPVGAGDQKSMDELRALRAEVERLTRINDELGQLVVRDTLTPLFNRRHFMASLNDRLQRLERYGTQAVLVFMDIDGMKAVNDGHGHGAGDFALNHVARLLSQAVRSTDIAARIGGDEFALLLEGMGEASGHDKVLQLANLLAAEPCVYGEVTLPITASFGCTELRPGDSDFAAIARADMAMYAAKRGRAALLGETLGTN